MFCAVGYQFGYQRGGPAHLAKNGGIYMPRKVFHSVPTKDGWAVKQSGKVVSNHKTQAASEKAAIRQGHQAENKGGLGQAVLHKSDGKIREERTYGADPE